MVVGNPMPVWQSPQAKVLRPSGFEGNVLENSAVANESILNKYSTPTVYLEPLERTIKGEKPSMEDLEMDKEEMLIQYAQKIADEAVKETQFTRQAVRDMEERMDRRYDALLKDTRESEVRIEKRFDTLLDRMEKQDTKIDNLKWWILGVCLTTALSIAAMVLSVIKAGATP